jgi:DNA repair exonuclease SbcCD ATPase subunit
VYQEAPNLEQRLGELQAQLDRLTVSLQLWREQQDHLKPAEDRLAELTRQCADIVTQWSTTGERQARAVGQLEERVSAFTAAEERLHADAAERLRTLERAIEQEWTELRKIHEAPVQELREQAESLSRLSVAATTTSMSGFDRAEARLTEIETALTERLSTVSDQLASAVAEIRSLAAVRPSEPAAQAWPIEGVVKLHNQMRDEGDAPAAPMTIPVESKPLALPPASPELLARIELVEQAIEERREEVRAATVEGHRANRMLRIVAAVAAVLVVAAAAGGWLLQRQASRAASRANDAERQAQQVVTAANQQMAAVREESAKQLAQAKEASARAQRVSDVLAAPDLVRYNITGAGPSAISGQVLWSRSRGVVFSGVRLPPAPGGMTYQLWLLTDGLPVTAGTFAPEQNGRITFTADPPRVPRPVVGAALTLEPAGGSQTPSEMVVQNRTVRPSP